MGLSPLVSGMFLWRDALWSQGSRGQVDCGLEQLSLTIGGFGRGSSWLRPSSHNYLVAISGSVGQLSVAEALGRGV